MTSHRLNLVGPAILFISLTAFAATSPPTGPAGGNDKFVVSANAAVDRIAREDGFSGAILVARGSHVLVRKAALFANRERSIPNTPEIRFPLESVTKQFTAAAILLLVEDGKVSLSDPISRYYSPTPAVWKDITVAQLLTHSSGIRDCFCGDFQSYKGLISLAERGPLAFAPGKGFLYSNTGYALLAAAIEKASGRSYADFMRNRIFVPLGMHHTGHGAIPGNALEGYVRSASAGHAEWRRGQPEKPERMAGFGGLYSTLDDMLIWSRALDGNKLLSPASRKAMFTDYGHNYGFGWRFANKIGRALVWHSGNNPDAGFASLIDRFPKEGLTVIVLTNNTGLTKSTATLMVGEQVTTFPANAARKVVDEVEDLYFTGRP